MTVQDKIVEIVKNIKVSEETVEFQIVSWPYSRKLITAVLQVRQIPFEYKRLDKRFDQFLIKAEQNVGKKLNAVISLVHKAAKDLGKGAKANTDAAEMIGNHLVSLQDEIEAHVPNDEEFVFEQQEPSKKGRKKKVADPIVAENQCDILGVSSEETIIDDLASQDDLVSETSNELEAEDDLVSEKPKKMSLKNFKKIARKPQ